MYKDNLYRESNNVREMIDGELNRIAITDDTDEIIRMMGYLVININKYAEFSKTRIREKEIRKYTRRYGSKPGLEL